VAITRISDLTPDRRNARKRTERSAGMIAKSLEKFGAARSVVIDENGQLLAGHGTIEAAAQVGIENVLVVPADGNTVVAVQRSNLTPEQKVQYALADNRSSDLSEWDAEVLSELADEHDLQDWFQQDELDDILGQVQELDSEEGLTDPDEVPEPPAEPVTKPGDVWLLGEHRVMCGDSTDTVAMEKLTQDKPADLWLTDPPYNVALGMNESAEEAKKRNRRTDGKVVQNDAMSDADFRDLLCSAFSAANCFLRPGASFYIWHADTEGFNFRGAARDTGWKVRQCLVWVKSSLVMGRQDYQWMHEPCLYGWTEGAAHYWGSDRKQTTVLQFEKPSRNGEHPTMKPVDLFQYQMANSSKPGECVLDSFGGSGTTLIAAERIGRKARLMELDPSYCDVIVKRWQDFTGKAATLEATGEPFPPDQPEAA
jgi:DNA modification methylase